MRIKQTLLRFGAVVGIVIGMTLAFVPTTYAEDCKSGEPCCGGVSTSIIQCDQTGKGGGAQNTGLWGILLLAINILTGLIGVAAVGGVVYGSILYASAGGNPEQVKKGITVITNVVIGVIAYALMYAVSNFLIPGGLFAQ